MYLKTTQKPASPERLHAMAKVLLRADEESWEWAHDLDVRIYVGLTPEDKYKLQEIINGLTFFNDEVSQVSE